MAGIMECDLTNSQVLLVVFRHPYENYEFVTWDDDIPNIWKNKFMFQTTNQQV
jgi:hypothetical protein